MSLRVQDGEGKGHPHGVIGAKRCPLALDEVTIDDQLNPFIGEIVLNSIVFFADNIHVAMKNHGGGIFITRSARLFDEDAVFLVLRIF